MIYYLNNKVRDSKEGEKVWGGIQDCRELVDTEVTAVVSEENKI